MSGEQRKGDRPYAAGSGGSDKDDKGCSTCEFLPRSDYGYKTDLGDDYFAGQRTSGECKDLCCRDIYCDGFELYDPPGSEPYASYICDENGCVPNAPRRSLCTLWRSADKSGSGRGSDAQIPKPGATIFDRYEHGKLRDACGGGSPMSVAITEGDNPGHYLPKGIGDPDNFATLSWPFFKYICDAADSEHASCEVENAEQCANITIPDAVKDGKQCITCHGDYSQQYECERDCELYAGQWIEPERICSSHYYSDKDHDRKRCGYDAHNKKCKAVAQPESCSVKPIGSHHYCGAV